MDKPNPVPFSEGYILENRLNIFTAGKGCI